jgi:GAF domain-containing protein
MENDVSKAPSHIACSSETRAELVLPVLAADGYVVAVLDLDSTRLNAFDDVDVRHLTRVCAWVAARAAGHGFAPGGPMARGNFP